MKSTFFIALLLTGVSCQSAAPKQEVAATATTPTDSTTVKAAVVEHKSTVPCTATGKLLEKFEQNNAVFERLEDADKELEWLKITSKDGKCYTIDDIRQANHFSVTFEDWDKDGMKDRIDNGKWSYEVNLFDRAKNDFSRHINGRFCGEQWDFDTKQGLKYQFLENKLGGIYELYKLEGATKTILSQVAAMTDYDNNDAVKIEIRKNIVETEDDMKFDTLVMDKQLLEAMKSNDNDDDNTHLARIKKGLETYWRKNLSAFLK